MLDSKIARATMLIGMLVGLTACSNTSPYIHDVRSVGSGHAITLDASKRTVLVNHDGQFCSEPSPDAIGTIFTQLAAELEAKGSGDGKVTADIKTKLESITSTGILELYQRSQGVQVLRDGMYRLCEAHLNKAISGTQYREGLVSLITTLNYVVPFELCTRLVNQRTIQVAEPGAGDQTGVGEGKNSNTSAKAMKVQTDKSIDQKVMSDCIQGTLDFVRLAQDYSIRSLEASSFLSVAAPTKSPSSISPPISTSPPPKLE